MYGLQRIELFYLNSTLNFGIPTVLVFQLEVYYKQFVTYLKLKDEKLEIVNETKLLGVFITSDLKWKKHRLFDQGG